MSSGVKNIDESRPLLPHINDSMLIRESWKIFQVMAEFVEGYERLFPIKPAVSLFGSARTKPDDKFYKLADETSEMISNAGFSVVTGGGPGVMEAANKGAYRGSSLSIGLNIVLPEERANQYQDISLRFRHFFTRKVMFFKYASAFVIFPGGYGTLDEFAEILALVQTGKTKKVPIILVHKEYWEGLITWFEKTLLPADMINPQDLELLDYAETADEIVQLLKDKVEI
ncbi:MAG: TIGR00730 family Rossman fold protein [Francisellaceae bacterium]|jgi:uncharacterized protein (TIGR00730 family)|nr:TIGR00730 family Rossman fold protein [Francisellaceae bacterium]MBT6539054.1 TIGR00730 family Rossman fold protein [Francisellaceae bacterium]